MPFLLGTATKTSAAINPIVVTVFRMTLTLWSLSSLSGCTATSRMAARGHWKSTMASTHFAAFQIPRRQQQLLPENAQLCSNSGTFVARSLYADKMQMFRPTDSNHVDSYSHPFPHSCRTVRFLSTTSSSSSSSSSEQQQQQQSSPTVELYSMSWVQNAVVDVLNELYSPADVARGNAMAKLNKSKKSKQKKNKKTNDDGAEESAEPEMSQEEMQKIIDEAVAAAPARFTISDAMVTVATKDEFGDFQVNAAMGLAKAIGLNPVQCAQQIVTALQPRIGAVMEEPEIAGPGFINLRFTVDYLAQAVSIMARNANDRLGIPPTAQKQKIVVDYSSPNIAKEMHVGHLRSTIIGDTISNLLEFMGHDVKRLNHVGDWGTQFGMLVEHLRDAYPAALNKETADQVDLGDLVVLYKAAKKRFDDDDDFKQRAREGVVKLQAGDPEALAAWESLCAASRKEYQKIYDLLNIRGLEERGESYYNPYLADVIVDLEKQGLAVKSDGATVVFLEGYANRDGTPLPMIVQKSDGGFNYATTDLAAIRHRTFLSPEESGERANRVLYVTDAGQAQHFEMVFKAAKLAGFVPEGVSLEHVPFGLVQGEDGKKFATRSGDTVKLKDLLNEAIRIAGEDLRSRNPEMAAAIDDTALQQRIDRVARIVGIGAVKYSDLSMNRESNYRFSYERMLSLNGNTAPYMLYAYARICGIIRKASGQDDNETVDWQSLTSFSNAPSTLIRISHESEYDLIRSLIKLPDVLREVEHELYPNRICDYLFETSQKFNQFYENCSVVKAPTEELKTSRLALCTATAGTIRLLLTLLGIQVVEKL